MSSIGLVMTLAIALLAAPEVARAQQRRFQFPGDSLGRAQPHADSSVTKRQPFAKQRDCPMLVVKPDTSRLERMPRVRVDSAKPAAMPVLPGCTATPK